MCTRYSLTKEGLVIAIGEIEIVIHVGARYNIAPRQKAPVIAAAGTGFSEVEMTWGWQPVWSNQLLINAKAETLTEESTFKKYLQQRCLIPADGFYEWTVGPALKLPVRFAAPSSHYTALAVKEADTPFMKEIMQGIPLVEGEKNESSVHNYIQSPQITQNTQSTTRVDMETVAFRCDE